MGREKRCTHKTLWSAAVYLNVFFREMGMKIPKVQTNKVKRLLVVFMHVCTYNTYICMCMCARVHMLTYYIYVGAYDF